MRVERKQGNIMFSRVARSTMKMKTVATVKDDESEREVSR